VAVVSGRHVTLSWQLFADAGVSGFNVEAGSASGLSNLAVVTVAGAERVISLLAPPGQYFCACARAMNAQWDLRRMKSW
jgi:hypothetical protein